MEYNKNDTKELIYKTDRKKMNTEILSADKDPMGAAILDFQQHGKAARLRVLSSMFEEDEMPVKHLFRSTREMPVLEQKALQLAKGRVLDIGAGSDNGKGMNVGTYKVL